MLIVGSILSRAMTIVADAVVAGLTESSSAVIVTVLSPSTSDMPDTCQFVVPVHVPLDPPDCHRTALTLPVAEPATDAVESLVQYLGAEDGTVICTDKSANAWAGASTHTATAAHVRTAAVSEDSQLSLRSRNTDSVPC